MANLLPELTPNPIQGRNLLADEPPAVGRNLLPEISPKTDREVAPPAISSQSNDGDWSKLKSRLLMGTMASNPLIGASLFLGDRVATYPGEIVKGVQRGYYRGKGDVYALSGATGLVEPSTAASGVVQAQKDVESIGYDDDVIESFKNYATLPNEIVPTLAWHLKHPKASTVMLGESLPAMGFALATSLGGAAAGSVVPGPGTLVGLGTGAFVGSGLPEAAATISDVAHDKGFDLSSEESMRNFFSNPAMMEEAKVEGAKRGIVVGAFDALATVIGAKGGGKFVADAAMAPFIKTAAAEMPRRAMAEVTANTMLEAFAGGAGAAFADLFTKGEIDWRAATSEFALEIPGSIPEAIQSSRIAQKGGKGGAAPTEEDIVKAGSVDLPDLTIEEAQSQGKSLFGFDQGDGKTFTVGTYEEALRHAGHGDRRKGKIVAVEPGEVVSARLVVDPRIVELTKAEAFTPYVTATVQELLAQYSREELQHNPDWTPTFVVTFKLAEIGDKYRRGQIQEDAVVGEIETAFSNAGYTMERSVANPASRSRVIQTPKNIIASFSVEPGNLIGGREGYRPSPNPTVKGLDLDKLQAGADAQNLVVIPDKVLLRDTQLAGKENRFKLFLDFNTPLAYDNFLTALNSSSQDFAKLFESGEVTWKNNRIAAPFLFQGFSVGNKVSAGSVGATTQAPDKAVVAKLVETSQVDTPQALDTVWRQRSGGEEIELPAISLSPDEKKKMYDALFPGGEIVGNYLTNPNIKKLGDFVTSLSRNLGLSQKIILLDRGSFKQYANTLVSIERPAFLSDITRFAGGNAGALAYYIPLRASGVSVIAVNDVDMNTSIAYSVITHELGHMISYQMLADAPYEVQLKIQQAYQNFLASTKLTRQDMQMWRTRRLSLLHSGNSNDLSARVLTPAIMQNADYYLSFEEWFAEQVAKWATTDAKPVGLLGKFFRKVALRIIGLLKETAKQRKVSLDLFRPEPEVAAYLDSLYSGRVKTNWGSVAQAQLQTNTAILNANQGVKDTPGQGDTAGLAQVLNAFGPKPGLAGAQPQLAISPKKLRAYVDRFNKFYKWAINYTQLADINPHIQELQLFRELMEMAQLEASNIMTHAEERMRRWKALPDKMGAALNSFLFAMNDMVYLTPQERAAGVRRWPSQAEFQTMVKNYGLDAETLALYVDIKNDFLLVIKRQETLQLQDAMKITDPTAQALAIKQARDMSRKLISAPYFPQTRFGTWSLTVRNANNKLEHFETFDTKGELQDALKRAVVHFPASAGFKVVGGTLPQEVQHFMGVPSWLLDKLYSAPGLTPTQKDWFDQLRYMLAPSLSFRKHLIKRKQTPGYSLDGRRAFASYFFHHARNFARIKYQDHLLKTIDSLGKSLPNNYDPVRGDINVRTQMSDFLRNVYKEFVNPSDDWAAFRSFTSVFYLGFVPASAITNLFQTVMASAPFAADKFGDVKAMSAFMRVTKELRTFYKKGTIATMSDVDMKAVTRGVAEGIIDESMAAELAATAVGAGSWVGKTVAGDKLKNGWLWTAEKSMWMFQMAEQGNRRVTFRAFFRLAMENPTASWLDELENKYYLEMQNLLKEGWTHREARAYLAGKDGVRTTHFKYDRLSRPRFMQGRKSAFFAFYMFTQNTLFMLWNNPQTAMRWALMMCLIAGPMGLVPDDVEDIIKWIGNKYGWNLEQDARKFVLSLLGEDSTIPADLILHGSGRYSFGIPALMEMAGATWAPKFDVSKMLSMQRIMPGNITAALEPGATWNEKVGKMTEGMAGASFGIPLAMFKAMSNSDLALHDLKRWEGAMPRAIRLGARAARQGIEGGERNKNYGQYLEYDMSNTEDVAELVGQALGFTPTRVSQYNDRQRAMREVQGFWEIQKGVLMEQAFYHLVVRKDKEAYAKVLQEIVNYNKRAPDAKLKISIDGLRSSIKNRMLNKAKTESGIAPGISPGVQQRVNELFPEVETISSRQVQ